MSKKELGKLTKTTIEGGDRIKHLFNKDWFKENGQGEIYLRYYSMPFKPKPDFYVPGLEGDTIIYSGAPFRVTVAHISKQNYVSHIPWLVKSESDNNQLFVEKIGRVLPDLDYILVSTPIRTGDDTYKNASLLMDGFVGMLRLISGNNLLRQFVREAKVDVSSGNMKTLTKVIPVPSEIEGPFATKEIWDQLKEITEGISNIADSQRGRIILATQLIERAFSSQDTFKFFSYWVALEVAAETHQHQGIISLLAKAYGQNNGYIQKTLGFQQLWNTRTAVFHDGEHYEIPSNVERYVQCLFLDVIRAKLGLICKRNMAGMVETGFDVNQLDRTVAQSKILTVEAP